jgi:hypothetical protein
MSSLLQPCRKLWHQKKTQNLPGGCLNYCAHCNKLCFLLDFFYKILPKFILFFME